MVMHVFFFHLGPKFPEIFFGRMRQSAQRVFVIVQVSYQIDVFFMRLSSY